MNVYMIFILVVMVGGYFLDVVVELLNLRHADPQVPQEFAGVYDPERYRKSQLYLQVTTKLGMFESTVSIVVMISFILLAGFEWVDSLARSFNLGSVLTGLVFSGIILLAGTLMKIPFSAYRTFVIEERFGFNQTTWRTFLLDRIKGLILGAILGGIILGVVFWLFETAGAWAWFFCWLALTGFQLVLGFLAPILIMPLFNKFIPLPEGELRRGIEAYTQKQELKMRGIFTMDGSKRSKKANAFFTGFGRFRRIVLLDTLISKHPVDELVAVLAHEIGHLKKRHIIKQLAVGILVSGIMFYLASWFVNNRELFDAFSVKQLSVYAGLIFFSFLYAPISILLGLLGKVVSRRSERQADEFAVKTTLKPESFISALKRLSMDNLSNLTPHPWYVFLNYSHPPIVKRVEQIRSTVISQSFSKCEPSASAGSEQICGESPQAMKPNQQGTDEKTVE